MCISLDFRILRIDFDLVDKFCQGYLIEFDNKICAYPRIWFISENILHIISLFFLEINLYLIDAKHKEVFLSL